ncbi:MAG TPA: hypothetical protein VLK36_10015 [Gaiellaceae bacterium]|nr:hypothetical protein [Gaiellaceae bacterium]
MAVVVLAALVFVPAAFAHHPVITASLSCDGVVSYTATAWATTSGLPGSRTDTDVRVYETKVNGGALTPAVQVGSGAFNSGNSYTFTGTFTVGVTVNTVTLNAKEIANWGDGAGSSGGTNVASTTTATRATTGCTPPPPPDQCPNIEGNQETVPVGMIKDESGNCVTPPPPDVCPNIQGNQATIPAGMIKDGSGNCVTPPPPDVCPNVDGIQATLPDGMVKDASGNCVTPPPPPSVTPPSATPTSVHKPSVVKKKTIVKHAKKKTVVKHVVKKKPKKKVKTHPKATQVRRPGVLPFTP